MRSLRVIVLMLLGACSATSPSAPSQILFDDFSYSSLDAFRSNGWIARTAVGWPGVEGATWTDGLRFVDEPAGNSNRFVRMTAMTDGAITQQAQFCHQRKYLE